MTLQGVTYTEKADAGKMLLAVCKEYPLTQPKEIGSYRGFQMEVYYDTVNTHYCLNLCGKTKHKVNLGEDALGNLTRIENELARIPDSWKRQRPDGRKFYRRLKMQRKNWRSLLILRTS